MTTKASRPGRAPQPVDFLQHEVYPHLPADDVFDWRSQFQHGVGQMAGRLPVDESESGTSFAVTPSSLLWFCAGCGVGGPRCVPLATTRAYRVTTRVRLRRYVRELAVLAEVPFPERHLTPDEIDAARKRARSRQRSRCVHRLQGLPVVAAGERPRISHGRGWTTMRFALSSSGCTIGA